MEKLFKKNFCSNLRIRVSEKSPLPFHSPPALPFSTKKDAWKLVPTVVWQCVPRFFTIVHILWLIQFLEIYPKDKQFSKTFYILDDLCHT